MKLQASRALEEKTRIFKESTEAEQKKRDLELELSQDQARILLAEQEGLYVLQQRCEAEREAAQAATARAVQEDISRQYALQKQNAEQNLLEKATEHAEIEAVALAAVKEKLAEMQHLTELQQQRASIELDALSVLQEKVFAENAAKEDAQTALLAEQEYLKEYQLKAQAEQEAKLAMKERLAAEKEAREIAEQNAGLEQQLAVTAKAYADELLVLQQAHLKNAAAEAEKLRLLQQQIALEQQSEELHRLAMSEIEQKLETEQLIYEESEKCLLLEQQVGAKRKERMALEMAAKNVLQGKLEREEQLSQNATQSIARQQAAANSPDSIAQKPAENVLETIIEKAVSHTTQLPCLIGQDTSAVAQTEASVPASAPAMPEPVFAQVQSNIVELRELKQQQFIAIQNQQFSKRMVQDLPKEMNHVDVLTSTLIDQLKQDTSKVWRKTALELQDAHPVMKEVLVEDCNNSIARPPAKLRTGTSVVFSLLACAGLVGAASWVDILKVLPVPLKAVFLKNPLLTVPWLQRVLNRWCKQQNCKLHLSHELKQTGSQE